MSATAEAGFGIRIADGQFLIDGRVECLYGGAVHYWRLERSVWDSILRQVKDLGFTMISIYIPWEVHEVEAGVFDFGQEDPRTDIDAFLTLCEEKGLRIVVRPGPQINSELTWFGYPKRILADAELHALSAQGSKVILTQVPKPIPALSYASDKFYDETASWYDAICPILARHAHPRGGIVAAQVDNEMAFFFGINAYSSDFSAASLARYRRFLLDKYGSVAALGVAHSRRYASVEEVDPPRRFSASTRADIPAHVDWVEYREHYLVDSMDRLAEMMRIRGLDGIALFHNYPHPLGPGGAASGFTTPFNLPLLEDKVDFVGFDIYSRKHLYHHVKTVGSYVVGTSRYPYIPEFIAGVWPWYLHPGDAYDEEFVTKAALMQGIKGFSRYMLVERDRWLDSPIRRDGRQRDKATMFARVNAMQETGEFAYLRRDADVLLLANREYDRLEAASVLVSFPGDFLETPSTFSEYPNRMTVAEDTLGFPQAIQVEKSAWFSAFYDALYAAGCGYVLSDTALAPKRWAQHRVLVLSTFSYLSSELQAALLDYVRSGGIAVIGPEVPQLDSLMNPVSLLADAFADATTHRGSWRDARVGDGRIVVVTELAGIADAVDWALRTTHAPRMSKSDDRIDVVSHRDTRDPARRVLFVCNPTPDTISVQVGVDTEILSAIDLWADSLVPVKAGDLVLDMPAYSITIAAVTT
jgi:beta-galactosidase